MPVALECNTRKERETHLLCLRELDMEIPPDTLETGRHDLHLVVKEYRTDLNNGLTSTSVQVVPKWVTLSLSMSKNSAPLGHW